MFYSAFEYLRASSRILASFQRITNPLKIKIKHTCQMCIFYIHTGTYTGGLGFNEIILSNEEKLFYYVAAQFVLLYFVNPPPTQIFFCLRACIHSPQVFCNMQDVILNCLVVHNVVCIIHCIGQMRFVNLYYTRMFYYNIVILLLIIDRLNQFLSKTNLMYCIIIYNYYYII
jgi:hypothetical protein